MTMPRVTSSAGVLLDTASGPVGFACPFVDAPPPKLRYPMLTTQALPVVLPVSNSEDDGPYSAATDRTKAVHVSSCGTHAVGSAAGGDGRHRSCQPRDLHISVSPQMESLPNGSASFVSTLSDDVDGPPTTVLASALRFCTVHDAVAPPSFHARDDVVGDLRSHVAALPFGSGADGMQSPKKRMPQSKADVALGTHCLSHDRTVIGAGPSSFVPLTSVAFGAVSTTTVPHAASGLASANASRGDVGAPLFGSAATSSLCCAMRGAPPAFLGSSKTAALLAAFKSSSVGPPHTHAPPLRPTTTGVCDAPALSRSYTKLFVGQVPPWANAKEWLACLFEPYGVREIVVKNFSDRVNAFLWCGSKVMADAAVTALDGFKYENNNVWYSLCVEPSSASSKAKSRFA